LSILQKFTVIKMCNEEDKVKEKGGGKNMAKFGEYVITTKKTIITDFAEKKDKRINKNALHT